MFISWLRKNIRGGSESLVHSRRLGKVQLEMLQIPRMRAWISKQQIFIRSLAWLALVLGLKLVVHLLGWEMLVLSPLHATAVAGGFFILGFILSATIADYKESERLPAEFTAIVENMYEDVLLISRRYPLDIERFREGLLAALDSLRDDVVSGNRETHHHVFALGEFFAQMEKAEVPPNYIVKLKQEQAQLVRNLFRDNYIQSIRFIPSAFFLAKSVLLGTIGLLLLTALEPFSTSFVAIGLIAFVFIYILRLIEVISTPFHPKGSTQDDISLFQVERTAEHLKRRTGNAENGH